MAVLSPVSPPTSNPAAAADLSPIYREAPNNLEAEQELLGAILINNAAAEKVSGFLLGEHFFSEVHRRIYDTAVKIIERGEIANPTTLKAFFERDDQLSNVGGPAYLARLAAEATSVINAEDYGKLIYDLAIRRNLIGIGESIVNRAYISEIDDNPDVQIEVAEQSLFQLASTGRSEQGFMDFASSLKTSVVMIENAWKSGGLSGVTSGLRDLDAKLGGMHKSDLVILAGRPAMGKTALATNMAFNAAKRYAETNGAEGAVVGFFSLEMSAEQIATRILAERTEISSEKLRTGDLSRDEIDRLFMASRELEQIPFFIDHTGAIPISMLRARARRLKRQRNLGLLVIDYLQLVRGSNSRRNDNRVQEVSEVTQALKAIAKDLDIPVLALSQLSRKVEDRDSKKPQLADLRESGAIEQDADLVMFVYREEYYERNNEPAMNTPEHIAWQQKMDQVHNLADVIIGKNRHGPTGEVKLHFEASLTRFSDYLPADHMPARFE